MALLEVKNLSISFGGLKAVDNFQISIEKGQLYGLIGPNGAGKTTIFNLLTGVYKPDAGSIELAGVNITGSLIQVLDIKIHMGHLLLSALFSGPDRRDIIFHFLKSQNPSLMRAQPRPSITGEHLLPSKQLHIKIR